MNTINQNKIILLSRKGLKEIRRAIHQLEHDREKIRQSLREQDKTNSKEETLRRIEYLSALDGIESELDDKRQIITNSKLLPARKNHIQVAIGSVVDLIDKYGHFYHYTIVDSVEANPSDGRISTKSPLGRSLLGRAEKDIIVLNNGQNYNQYQLVRVC